MKNIFKWLFKKSDGFVIPEVKNIPPPPPKEKRILSKSDFRLLEYKGYWKIKIKIYIHLQEYSDRFFSEYYTKEKAIESIEYIVDDYNNYPKIHEL